MKSRQGRILAVLLSAAVLVGGANLAAYAANGQPLLLGHSNKATKTTKLKNSKGVALSLKSKAGTAPLSVSSSTTVGNLSADLLDGQDGAALRNRTYVYTVSGTSTSMDTAFPLPGLPAGKYLATFAIGADFTSAVGSFGCFFSNGHNSSISLVGVHPSGSTIAWSSASGYLDTTTGPLSLVCEKGGGGTMTIPSALTPPGAAQVSLTRLDDVTATTTTGAPITMVP
jgi:hypothetical protein